MNLVPKPTKVLYIASEVRSGSTLLELLLGRSVASTFMAGEIAAIWQHGFIENFLCGCGRPLQQCDFWVAVVQKAFGGWQGVDPHRMLKLWGAIGRIRNAATTGLRIAAQRATFHEELRELSTTWHSLYTAIQEVSGCQVIIDSSKVPVGCLILNEIGGIDSYILHLVRDSRAVAYSLQRRRLRPEVTDRAEYMAQFNPLASALRWVIVNLMISGNARDCRHYKRLRYRRLVERPQGAVADIAAYIGEPADDSGWIDGHVIQLGDNHTLGGNPVRFKRGWMEIRSDDEWRDKMPCAQQWLVTGLTSPVLWHYGYFRQNNGRV